MKSNNYDGYTVKDLQDHAASGVKVARKRIYAPSRAARLELVDILSRRGSIGLYILATASLGIAILSYPHSPDRTLAWGAIVSIALFVSIAFLSRFRSGRSDNSRPFRWRAEYTSTLSVVGVAFASAPLLLAHDASLLSLHKQIALITLSAALLAAFFHASHYTSSIALPPPAAMFLLLAQVQRFSLTSNIVEFAILAIGIFAVFLSNRGIIAQAKKRNPRSGFVRAEVDSASNARNIDREFQDSALPQSMN